MTYEKMLEMAKMINMYISDIKHLKSLLECFSSDDEIDEMVDFMKNHDDLTKYDVNAEVHSITMRRRGIDFPSYEEMKNIREVEQ